MVGRHHSKKIRIDKWVSTPYFGRVLFVTSAPSYDQVALSSQSLAKTSATFASEYHLHRSRGVK
jgi:hypothetical protein